DVTQATYERAIGALRRFRGDSSAATWLIGIARNVLLENDRAAARRQQDVRRIDASELFEPGPASRVHLAELVRGLDAERRDASVLTQVMGFRYEEAAAICGCPTGTIRSRVARARSQLIAMLDDGASEKTARRV